ncbi:hypothetical protein ACIQCG_00695 [Streptomyces noursei]|uniref:hypothetical protein n=1 Tax=Streptomyces noursei TaxID=1971 RepID=UPI00381BE31C
MHDAIVIPIRATKKPPARTPERPLPAHSELAAPLTARSRDLRPHEVHTATPGADEIDVRTWLMGRVTL